MKQNLFSQNVAHPYTLALSFKVLRIDIYVSNFASHIFKGVISSPQAWFWLMTFSNCAKNGLKVLRLMVSETILIGRRLTDLKKCG